MCREKRDLLEKHLEKRTTALDAVSEIQDELFAHRSGVASRLSTLLSPMVSVTIEQFGNTQKYEELLAEGLRNSGVQSGRTARKIVATMPPKEFAAAVRRRDCDRLVEVVGGLNREQAEKTMRSHIRHGAELAEHFVETEGIVCHWIV